MSLPSEDSTGFIPFTHDSETHQTWYRLVGTLSRTTRPLVVLHGGPGVPCQYMFPLSALWKTHRIPVIFYDQLGCGKSTHLPDRPASFWNVELFMDELENLLAYFGIADNFAMLGHSWGGMLGSNWVAARKESAVGLKKLVLSSSPASMDLWMECVNELLKGFPEEVREVAVTYEREGSLESKEYEKAMEVFNNRHVCTLQPWPEELVESLRDMEADMAVTDAMVGRTTFVCTTTLKDWSVVDIVHNIQCPTLVTHGAQDEAGYAAIRPFLDNIPNVQRAVFEKSSHVPMFEEREVYIEVIGSFLKAQ